MGKNEIQEVTPQKKHGLKISRGNTTLEFSPEQTEQICNNIMELGRQFISQTTELTLEAFDKEVAAYYRQLDTYLQNAMDDSNERKGILQKINQLTDQFLQEMNNAEDNEEWERCKKTYEVVMERQEKLYFGNLEQRNNSIPQPPKFFARLFGRK